MKFSLPKADVGQSQRTQEQSICRLCMPVAKLGVSAVINKIFGVSREPNVATCQRLQDNTRSEQNDLNFDPR